MYFYQNPVDVKCQYDNSINVPIKPCDVKFNTDSQQLVALLGFCGFFTWIIPFILRYDL